MVAAAVIGGMGVGPAQAAPYDNVNPQGHVCSNTAITARSKNLYRRVMMYPGAYTDVYVGKVELRYSTACRTAWARVTEDTSFYIKYIQVFVERKANSAAGISQLKLDVSQCNSAATSCWTNMVYDGGTFAQGQGILTFNESEAAIGYTDWY